MIAISQPVYRCLAIACHRNITTATVDQVLSGIRYATSAGSPPVTAISSTNVVGITACANCSIWHRFVTRRQAVWRRALGLTGWLHRSGALLRPVDSLRSDSGGSPAED